MLDLRFLCPGFSNCCLVCCTFSFLLMSLVVAFGTAQEEEMVTNILNHFNFLF